MFKTEAKWTWLNVSLEFSWTWGREFPFYFDLLIAQIFFFSYWSTSGQGWGAPEKALLPCNLMDRKFHFLPQRILRMPCSMTWGQALKIAWGPLWSNTGWKELCAVIRHTCYNVEWATKGVLKTYWIAGQESTCETFPQCINYFDMNKGGGWARPLVPFSSTVCVSVPVSCWPRICFVPAPRTSASASG